ncbi:O-antigen ligase family protein [Burkholderia stabilis]|uniref:O-antigen ligase family protein n=1 Tax=Burkholderia stabilis TaxID=95485 RepID=UPI00158A2702|nr:O-antigen ligase family protein [Burkholderia stabilis]
MTDTRYPHAIAAPLQRVGDRPARISATFVWIVLGLGLILSPVGDFLSVYAKNSVAVQGSDARVSLVVRGLMIAGLLTATLWSFRAQIAGVRVAIAAALAVCVTLVSYALGSMTPREAVEQVIYVLKVFSFFVYPAAMMQLGDKRLAQIETVVFASLLAYGAAIVLGATLSIEMFRSYQAQTHIRSGYKGIIYAQNEAAALVVVSIAFGYLHALVRGWSLRSVALVGCMLIAALLTGTKGAVVGVLGMTCVYFYSRHNAIKATRYAVIMIGGLAVSAVLAYLFIPQVSQAVELSQRYFSSQGSRIGSDKIATLLLSGRNLKFAAIWADLRQQDFVALLTGGYPVVRYMVEIDVPDLILMFGLPIFLVYFIALIRAFVRRGPHTRGRRFGLLFFLVLIAMASSAGHVLGSAVIAPYLALIAVMIQRDVRHAREQRNAYDH